MTGKMPTVRQRELTKRLRDLRNQRGLTVEEVAEKLLCPAAKISRLETGERAPSLRDVRDLCELYQVDEPSLAEFMTLAREARMQGWWRVQYDDLELNPYIGLEQEAAAITSYTMYCIPALLQTHDYARTIIGAIAPRIDVPAHRQRIETRMRRQQLLEQDNRPRYHALMDEAVLRRGVGGPLLMAIQLEKVLETVRRGQVTIQVVPFAAGAHAAQDSNFLLFEFEARSNQSPVVFVEGLGANQYLEKPDDIARYREAVERLHDSALNPRDSLGLVTEIKEAYVACT
jgi:transcriptional regulator with XRE-family HTH domain